MACLKPPFKEIIKVAYYAVSELGLLALTVNMPGLYMAQGECCNHHFINIYKRHYARLIAVN
jgi:hypothetical protein